MSLGIPAEILANRMASRFRKGGGGEGCPEEGWVLSTGGLSLPCDLSHDAHPEQNNRQTRVKTLPFRNYCYGR